MYRALQSSTRWHGIRCWPFLLAAALPLLASAQLAPVEGTHYAGRSSDTGYAGSANSTGGYGASVPLDLPPADGGLPIPLQLVYGGNQVGAAGLGWDVPLSYIFRSKTIAHRRPTAALNAPELLSIVISGDRTDLVRNSAGTAWVGQRGYAQIEVRDTGDGSMVMYDGDGRTYFFNAQGASSGSRLVDGNLYLLRNITGSGTNTVHLEYAIGAPTLPGGGSGLSIDLANVTYNTHPTTATCTKHQVQLNYDGAATTPLSMSTMGGKILARMRKLATISVNSRATCAAEAVSLRRYNFAYEADPDTQRPQLHAVTMIGQQGTPERSITLPIATYSYGTVSEPTTHQITYEKAQTVAPTFFAGASTFLYGVGYSQPVDSTEAHDPNDFLTDLTSVQTLADLNGDGRADFFDETGFYQNTPAANGISTFSAGYSSGTSVNMRNLVHSSIHNGANIYDRASGTGINDTLREQIDMNGDGRLDIVETVLPDTDHWIIHLNTPDPADPKNIVWVDVTVPVASIRTALNTTGLTFGRVPMSRNSSGRNTFAHCWFWNASNARWQVDVITGCSDIPANYTLSKTITEFQLQDVNGDGYPDFVFNASRANYTDPVAKPPIPSNPVNLQHASTLVGSDLAGSRDIKVLINTAGVHLSNNVNLFAGPPVTLEAGGTSGCGIARWEPDAGIVATDTRLKVNQTCGLEDVNGDGIVDRISTSTISGQPITKAALGTGDLASPFSSAATITLPGPIGRTENEAVDIDNDWQTPCNRAIDTQFYDIQRTRGLRDINGDGLPDFISGTRSASTGSVSWTVEMGTGTSFASPIAVVGDVGLELSLERNFCPRSATSFVPVGTSSTPTGLYDIDGDGQPEVVTLAPDDGHSLPHWDVYQLKAPGSQGAGDFSWSVPSAGRLTAVDNGYGAINRIGYRSAKDDIYSAHNIPYPETVVTIEMTTDADFKPLSQPIRHAYGNSGLIFDSMADAFIFPGYRRAVTSAFALATSPSTINDGMATLTDTYGLAPFVASMDAAARFQRNMKVGHVSDVTTLSGTIGGDPWALLGVDITRDARRIAGTHYDWQARLLPGGSAPANNERCLDLMFPYDFAASQANDLGDDQCTAHGFAFQKSQFSYRGTPGTADAVTSRQTIQTSATVDSVDDFGRITSVRQDNDLTRGDDDLCLQTAFATPTGTNERVLNAPTSRTATTCVTGSGSPVVLARDRFEYDTTPAGDKLPAGKVSRGFITARIASRLDENGTSLGDIRLSDVTYDASGNPLTVTKVRDDGARQKVTMAYDPFGLMPLTVTTDATNPDGTKPPSLTTTTTVDDVTLAPLSTTDANGAISSHTFDGFTRVLLSKVKPTGGNEGVLSSMSYNGFGIGQTGGRTVTQKVFTDPVAVANVGSAAGRTGKTMIDSLGRAVLTEAQLGADYANKKVIVGARRFDLFGRVLFEADPYLSTDDDSTTYGTSRYFNTDGTLSCSIRGKGRQPFVDHPITDEVNEVYPTCVSRRFANNAEIVDTRDAASLLSGSEQYGTVHHTQYTAIGRPVVASTEGGGSWGVLERSTFAYDALGRMTVMTRFANAAVATGGTSTTWHYDSLGWMTKLEEYDSAPQISNFDSWGEVTSTQWCDATISSCAGSGAVNRSIISRYDALGRKVHGEDQTKGVVDPQTVNDYVYDIGVNNATPSVTATNVKGRLAKATSPTSKVSFSYDGLGRVNAKVFTDRTVGSNNVYVQKQDFHGDGSPQTLHLLLPDNAFKDEKVDYSYDSAARPRSVKYNDGASQDLFTASGSTDIYDVLGRIRSAKYGAATLTAAYADTGRNLLNQVKVTSPGTPEHSRTIKWGAPNIMGLAMPDPSGRERERLELIDGASTGLKTTYHYDAIGRLASAKTITTAGGATQADRQFTYDPLGNILSQTDNLGSHAGSVALTYQTAANGDRDRICSVGYGGATPPSTCNVQVKYDGMGNITSMPARSGTRALSYFANGEVKTIANGSTSATFDYDAFGGVQQLTLTTPSADKRHDKHFGGFISRRDEGAASVVTRSIPAPGLTATRHGPSGPWTFVFGEDRGTRFVTDQTGAFTQDVDYQPFGEARNPTGAQPGTQKYVSEQWNQGDALQALGLSQLGARIYDPVIGRFLSRDPLIIPSNAASTNPYAFASNDPVNSSDPTGLSTDLSDTKNPQKCNAECQKGITSTPATNPSPPASAPTSAPKANGSIEIVGRGDMNTGGSSSIPELLGTEGLPSGTSLGSFDTTGGQGTGSGDGGAGRSLFGEGPLNSTHEGSRAEDTAEGSKWAGAGAGAVENATHELHGVSASAKWVARGLGGLELAVDTYEFAREPSGKNAGRLILTGGEILAVEFGGPIGIGCVVAIEACILLAPDDNFKQKLATQEYRDRVNKYEVIDGVRWRSYFHYSARDENGDWKLFHRPTIFQEQCQCSSVDDNDFDYFDNTSPIPGPDQEQLPDEWACTGYCPD